MSYFRRRKDALLPEEERCPTSGGGKMSYFRRRKDALLSEEERCSTFGKASHTAHISARICHNTVTVRYLCIAL